MGTPMAGRLIERGFPVTVWNRTRARCDVLAARGAKVAPGLATLAQTSDIVVTMVADPAALDDVIAGLMPGLGPTCVVVDMSTVGPAATARAAARVAEAGALFLDAPVLGTVPQAGTGELRIFVGGQASAFERARAVLEALGRPVIRCGPVGAGSATKLGANLLLVRMADALADLLVLARAAGLDPAALLAALDGTIVASPYWQRGLDLIDRDPARNFPLRLARKDLRLMLDLADLPTTRAVLARLDEAAAAGLDEAHYTMFVRRALGLT